jgi:hypothetical protein
MFAKMLQSIFPNGVPRENEVAMEGAIYVTPQEDGTFHPLKVLKTDEFGVHLRLYSNSYTSLPQLIDESTLYLAGIGREPGVRLGMGHIPVSYDSFTAWRALFIQQSTVDPDELDGYEVWKEAEGGYF